VGKDIGRLKLIGINVPGLPSEAQAMATARHSLELVPANYACGIATYSEVLITEMQFNQAPFANILAMPLVIKIPSLFL
jgi:hypothetical protein